ncbi:MAG: endonuclease domain-containing protein [Saprospiraceae bacterium]
MKTNMHYGASPSIFNVAQNLRVRLTEAEKILWEYLRNHQSGFRFRRQHPLWNYVVDFYSHRLKLVIEVDGEIHSSEEAHIRDSEKDNGLRNLGLQILRFTNAEVFTTFESVKLKIDNTVIEILTEKYKK